MKTKYILKTPENLKERTYQKPTVIKKGKYTIKIIYFKTHREAELKGSKKSIPHFTIRNNDATDDMIVDFIGSYLKERGEGWDKND